MKKRTWYEKMLRYLAAVGRRKEHRQRLLLRMNPDAYILVYGVGRVEL